MKSPPTSVGGLDVYVGLLILQLAQDVGFDLFQLALLPQTFFPLAGEGEDNVEVHVGTGKETVGIFAEEIGMPGFLGRFGIRFGL